MLFAQLHAHAFELLAAAASNRAADLAMWLGQLIAPSVSNSHSCGRSNNHIVKNVLIRSLPLTGQSSAYRSGINVPRLNIKLLSETRQDRPIN